MWPLALLVPLIVIWASSDKTNAYSAIVASTKVHVSKIFSPPSTPIGNFARRSSQGYREIKYKQGQSQNASHLFYSHLNSLSAKSVLAGEQLVAMYSFSTYD